MTRDRQNQRRARYFIYAFGCLVAADAALGSAHAVFFSQAWRHDDKEVLVELAVSSTHFLTNTIAIVDILVHLLRFDRDDGCAFESAKSTNAFLFSCIGAYADVVGVSFSPPSTPRRVFAWALFGESVASAAVSVACFWWGRGTLRVCEDKRAQMGTRQAPKL